MIGQMNWSFLEDVYVLVPSLDSKHNISHPPYPVYEKFYFSEFGVQIPYSGGTVPDPGPT